MEEERGLRCGFRKEDGGREHNVVHTCGILSLLQKKIADTICFAEPSTGTKPGRGSRENTRGAEPGIVSQISGIVLMLTGQVKPTAGSAAVLGIDAVADPVLVRRMIGIIPEQE